jgi:anti-sigma regulatory factor (Ser/Thr protein kinase)
VSRFTARVPSDLRTIRLRVGRKLAAAGCTAEGIDDTLVMLSELMTNALLHAGSEARVHLLIAAGRVRVTVCDTSGEAPVVRPLDAERVGGNGLRIVQALADDWGASSLGSGKEVWFERSC